VEMIQIQVNMCEQIDLGNFDPATQAVFVAGGAAYPNCGNMMVDPDLDNVFELTNTYNDGTVIAYKFYIATPADANTGNCGGAGFEDALPAPCGFGMYGDREYIVNGMDEIIGSVCFSSCDDCTTCFDPCPPDYAGANQLTGIETGMMLYETNGILESDQEIDVTADVIYNSATEITLLPGFSTNLGAIFEAFIEGCMTTFGSEDSSETLQSEDNTTESKDKN